MKQRLAETGIICLVVVLVVGSANVQAQIAKNVAQKSPCAPPTNAIACENSKPGNPTAEWEIDSDGNGVGDGFNDGDPNLQGFATDISVNHGETVHFKIKTTLAS